VVNVCLGDVSLRLVLKTVTWYWDMVVVGLKDTSVGASLLQRSEQQGLLSLTAQRAVCET